jgi:Fungal cellulose binding domain
MGGYGDDGDGECARRWEQCAGGLDYIGPMCCTGNSECTRKNAWYGQCTPLPVPPGVSAWWAQCGGRGYRGPTACEEGSECMQQDESCSQCVPVMYKADGRATVVVSVHGSLTQPSLMST